MNFQTTYKRRLESALQCANQYGRHEDLVFNTFTVEGLLDGIKPAYLLLKRRLSNPKVKLWPDEPVEELTTHIETLENALDEITVRENLMLRIVFGKELNEWIHMLRNPKSSGISVSLQFLSNEYFETRDELRFLEFQEYLEKSLIKLKSEETLSQIRSDHYDDSTFKTRQLLDERKHEELIKGYLHNLASWENLIEDLSIYEDFFSG